MQSLRALLLLTACLAVTANPVPTLPDDLQVQENFNLSRVRLAFLGVMAVSEQLGLAVGGKPCLPRGLSLPIWNSRGGPLKAFPALPSGIC